VHSTNYTAWFMWIWCAAWWSNLGILWSVNKELILVDLRGPWDVALPTTLPFVAGLIGILFADSLTWKLWRYGDVVLLIDTLPGYLGEVFRGPVHVGPGGKPAHPVAVELTCGSLPSE
jgi:hypothetical protein